MVKNRIIRVFSLCVSLAFPALASISAQGISSADIHRFNIGILERLDDLDRLSSFSEKSDGQAFINLFESPDTPSVYNDIAGTADFQKMLTPDAYFSLIPEGGNFLLKTDFSDVKKESDVYEKDGKLHRTISVKKYIMAIDATVYSGGQGGVFFDSSELFRNDPDFILDIDFSFDPSTGNCHIASINARNHKSRSPLDEDKYSILLQPSSKFDNRLKTKGEAVNFNGYGQAVVYHDDVDISSENVRSETNKVAEGENYDVICMNFKPLKFRLKLHGSYLPLSAYNITASYSGINSNSNGLEGGVDIGFEASPMNAVRLGLFLGGAFSSTKINLSVSNVNYSYVAGDLGSRSYNFSATENLAFMDVNIPLYLGMEFDVTKWMMIDLDLGAKAYLNIKTTVGDYFVNGTLAGKSVNQTFSKFISPADCTRENFEASLFANLSLDFRLARRLLYAYLSAGYEYGLTPSYKNGNRAYLNESAGVYPFVYSAAEQADIPFRSLVGSIEFQRRAFLTSIGLKFKF